jgi:hypothetical protein
VRSPAGVRPGPLLPVSLGVVDGLEQPQSVAPCLSFLDGGSLGAHYLLLPLLAGRAPFLIAQQSVDDVA